MLNKFASRRLLLRALPFAALGGAVACSGATGSGSQEGASDAADAQTAPALRFYGTSAGGLVEKLQEAYRALHPDQNFSNTLPTSDAALPALITYSTDLAPNGGDLSLTETLGFFETRGYHVSSIVVASGTYDVEHRSNGPVVFVHESNPIASLSVEQLDGVFGAERTGGLKGFEWTPSLGRGADKNIRRWGDLGLVGEWADKEIQTYGHAPSGASRFFRYHVIGNSDKWNPNYKEYVETGSKMISPEDKAEQRLGTRHMLQSELAENPFGIGWSIMSQAKGISGIKPIAVAPRGSEEAIQPTANSFRDRTYPFVRNINIFFDKAPGEPLRPDIHSFLEFALGPQGQAIVESVGYYPLPEKFRQEQISVLTS